MASVGVINGTLVRFYFNTTGSTYAVIGNSMECGFEYSHAPRETTSQDSGGKATFLEGKRSATCSFSSLHSEDAAVNFWDFFDKLDGSDRGRIGGRINTGVQGDNYIEFTGWLTQLSLAAGGVEGNATYNGAVQITGSMTKSTNA